ncbi:winged helix DNA-binding protein [Staphylococcus equorum]|uniref:Winged helix DNA-binding protein n=1 Tax=Staphylococcus equorum TaxID=246432 RepID=A0A9X4L7K6_9STAP|nr:winged helix DNA-binding protein [Staphylococcus equorum]MDG0842020.1 winged helix DNA-binding protein [Staphylococcus equorum]MDG0857929.1 winged helix DNA-binding protein [Staphylococcus equorum]
MANVKSIEGLDLIDLISERHGELRQQVNTITSERIQGVQFSSSEWYLINKINYEKPSFAELTRKIHLTRQAIHKAIKQLEHKGVVQVEAVPNNKKEKRVVLTELGAQCYEHYKDYKSQVIKHMETVIGSRQIEQLKQVLQQDWHLEDIEINTK